jgi:O-antigen/teichoic acid export membrane protein
MNSSVRSHYGFSAISRSLKPFLIGKGLRLLVSVGVLVLLARYLPRDQYAIYVSLQALITITGAISSVGVQQAMLRYMPELRVIGNNLAMYRMLAIGMMLRVALVTTVLLLGLPFARWFGDTFGITSWLWVLPWYAGVGVLRLSAMALSQSLEALLWQRQAQYGMAIGGFVRFLGILGMQVFGQLDLWAVIQIELCSEAISLLLLVIGWHSQRSKDEHKHDGDLAWWTENRSRVFRFGAWSGLLNQTRILYGSAPNRLIAAHFLGAGELAILGFADGLNNLVRRMMPTRMMISMIRPVFMAHYSDRQDFDQLVRLSNLVYRLNLTLLALPIALLLVIGEPIFNWVTADKYGTAAYLLAGFLALMVTEGMNATLELLVQAVEKNQILLTNLIQSLSLFIAIPLFAYLGLWALVVVNITGTILANMVIVMLLRKHGHHFRLDIGLALLIVFYSLISGVAGWWSLQVFNSYLLSASLMVLIFAVCMFVKPPLLGNEKEMLKVLIMNQLRKKKGRTG